jgi:hypothetical protein
MDIPNLSNQQSSFNQSSNTQLSKALTGSDKKNYIYYSVVIIAAVLVGFSASRFFPSHTGEVSKSDSLVSNQAAQATDTSDLKVGVVYGNTSKTFADKAEGTIKSGGINGEGTHTLERAGGKTQNAALTSSVVDLDLFVGKKVEVDGETNSSNKAGWLMDVGSIKILE